MSDLELMNAQLVGAQAGMVVVQFPVTVMEPEHARVHAAWLVSVADALDPDGTPFDEVLAAVRNT